jgi:type 1 fimbria pilin
MRFNHFKKSAVAITLGLGLMQAAQAQLVADQKVAFAATITANTCRLVATPTGGTASTGPGAALTVDLGNISIPTTATALGTPLSPVRTVTFSLVSGSGSGTCPAGTAGQTLYNMVMDVKNDRILTAGSATYRRNDVLTTASGTNAVLALNSGAGSTSSTAPNLTLRERVGFGSGTRLAGAGSAFGSAVTLNLQLVASSTAPTPGTFSASMPLFLTYQ